MAFNDLPHDEMWRVFSDTVVSIVKTGAKYPAKPMDTCGNTCKKCGIRRVSELMCICHPIDNEEIGWHEIPFKVNITNKFENFKLKKSMLCELLTTAMNKLEVGNDVKILISNPYYQSYDNDRCEELSFGMTMVRCNENSKLSRETVQIIGGKDYTSADDIRNEFLVDIYDENYIARLYTSFVDTLGMICNDLESGGIH